MAEPSGPPETWHVAGNLIVTADGEGVAVVQHLKDRPRIAFLPDLERRCVEMEGLLRLLATFPPPNALCECPTCDAKRGARRLLQRLDAERAAKLEPEKGASA